ncbi:MAG: methylthioribose-phosphate isomerase [Pseudonocardiales bacterium]|nr:methylthioribose-phosphate isomerase [Pseudonocardiales bacterium]
MRTIDWVDGAVRIIDQTRLPAELVSIETREVDELVVHIRSLAVRGAPALGVAGALGMALAACRSAERDGDLDADLAVAAEKISAARPTAVNLSWGVAQLSSARAAGAEVEALVAAALAIRDADIEINQALSDRGAQLLAGARRVLTHCNAGALACVEFGTALGVIERLHAAAPLEMVYVCETRPLLQGSRLTAWELGRRGIPHRIIVDSAAAGLVLSGEIEAVVVGADRIAANGDVANKVGTVSHALAASYAGIPFVVAAPESTIDRATDSGAGICIELRDADEVLTLAGRRVAAPGSTGWNPAFDVTPAALITAIVTELRTIDGRADSSVPDGTGRAADGRAAPRKVSRHG